MNGVPIGLFVLCQDTKRGHRPGDFSLLARGASLGLRQIRRGAKSANGPEGFSLLEMMVVITVILMVASMSAPLYMTAMVRVREAVLADDLFTMRSLIDRFTLDPADAGPRSRPAGRVGGRRLSGETPDRPLHGIKRNLASPAGRRASLSEANVLGDCGRTQRLEPRFARRHAVQHVVGQGGKLVGAGGPGPGLNAPRHRSRFGA